jgi:hypothetical protein
VATVRDVLQLRFPGDSDAVVSDAGRPLDSLLPNENHNASIIITAVASATGTSPGLGQQWGGDGPGRQ